MTKTKIICVVGATASGKTALSIELAKALDGEIISADSMQVYKNMPIATAVATKEEQQGVTHYLTEFLEPSESFSVADFVALAKEKIEIIKSKNKTPIIVGGTGLFVDSLVKDITFSDVSANEELRGELHELTNDQLYDKLLELDEQAARDVHKNNRKRVIRALELAMSGTSKTEQNKNSQLNESPYDALYIGIGYEDRQRLYDRINLRVDLMVEAGLLEEAKAMQDNKGITSTQAIGHKELMPYLNGEISLEDALEHLKMETRHYAKRQLTWFRRNKDIHWFMADTMPMEELVANSVSLAKGFLED